VSAGLREREQALGAVGRCLDRARAGAGGVLFIVAEPGLGKTSVLDRGRELATSDMEVGVGRGEEMESALPFGLTAQVMHALDGAPVDATGADAEPAVEPSTPYHRVLRWLEQREGRPLLLALDDLHWADPDSLNLTAFLARRIGHLPVALIATLRPWPAEALEACRGLAGTGRATLERLAPLSRGSSDAMLVERVGNGVSEGDERRTWELCRGNPLLIEQVARAIEGGERLPQHGDSSPAFREQLMLARFAGLDEPSMRCARAASVLGTGFPPELAAEAAGLDGGEVDGALDALFRSGLVVEGDGEMRFAHPLFGVALYEDIAPPVRRRLHARLFELLVARGLESEASEHAVRADLVGDERAVEVCERAGRGALAAGAVATAARHLGEAVRLAGERASPRLLVGSGEALTASGRVEEAATVCERLLREAELDWSDRVDALRMLGRARYLSGAPDHGAAALAEAAEIAAAHEPARAVQPLLDQSLSGWLTGGPAQALPLAARARDVAREAGDDRLREQAGAVWGHIAFESGDPEGLATTSRLARYLERGPGAPRADPAELSWPWATLYQFAQNAAEAEQYDQAIGAYRLARTTAERAGAANALATVAIFVSDLEIRRGHLRAALDEAIRAEEFSELTPGVLPYAALARAESLLWLGRLEESEEHCRRAAEGAPGQWFAAVWLAHIRGLRLLWEGDRGASDALRDAEELTRAVEVREPCLVHWGAHAVAAHIVADRLDDAVRVVEWLEECAEPLPCRWPRFAATLGRAMLAEHAGEQEAAEAGFRDSLSLIEEVELPLQRVEALLAYGGFLRRRGRDVDARPRIAEAVRIAEEHEAGWLSERAREELALAGGRRRRGAEERDHLTPAELRVARLAAEGHTNPEIARRLHLSTNTVATHLKHVYSKLEIGSRRELMTLDRDLDADS
jgi:DNA-binding CsgD family transcriptional regulator